MLATASPDTSMLAAASPNTSKLAAASPKVTEPGTPCTSKECSPAAAASPAWVRKGDFGDMVKEAANEVGMPPSEFLMTLRKQNPMTLKEILGQGRKFAMDIVNKLKEEVVQSKKMDKFSEKLCERLDEGTDDEAGGDGKHAQPDTGGTPAKPILQPVESQMNSVTHPAAWASFTRVLKNKKKFPVKLLSEVKADKQGSFEIYMACCKDIAKTIELITQKVMVKESKGTVKFEFKKRRDILPMYGGDEKKVDKFIGKLHYIAFEFLPDDPEERLYILRTGVAWEKLESQREELLCRAASNIDEQMGQALMGAGGAMGDHSMVAIPPKKKHNKK